jgi:predicted membrane chloride channel (bestrophin family)
MAMMLTGRILLCHVISLAVVLLNRHLTTLQGNYNLILILGLYLLGPYSTKACRIK